MPDERGYIEVERANGETARLRPVEEAPDYVNDREVRLRVGEVIARATQAARGAADHKRRQ